MKLTPRAGSGFRHEPPTGTLRGSFQITDAAIAALEQLLPTYRGPDGPHEGICFLCGYEIGIVTLYVSAIAPDADHGPGHVRCSEREIAAVTKAAREHGLGLLAQVHSHPSGLTGHSLGDDEMVFMPFEGMLSIVVPEYGRFGLRPLDSLGVHQYQGGRWLLCSRASIRANFTIVPALRDLR
jgi:proteasome lid subunit RPN8/RPN11